MFKISPNDFIFKVVSGDCVVIRSLTSKDGKALEKRLMLSSINAPRLARAANPNSADSVAENDQVKPELIDNFQ